MTSDPSTLCAGAKTRLESSIKNLKPHLLYDFFFSGWSQLFLLSASNGINDGMMAWGDRMLKYTGKPRADKFRDTTHSTIGFWTDNGGYYHYALGNKSMGSTYEEVLPKVKQYHDDIGVPFGHWQFDSWFNPKDAGVNAGGGTPPSPPPMFRRLTPHSLF